MRTVADAADHPVLSGIRSGAVSGLIIVAVLSLPVLLILSAKAPPPATFEPEARVWAASAEAEVPVRLPARSMPAPIPVAAASPAPAPEPSRARVGAGRTPLSLDLLPVLDDASGGVPPDEPPLTDTRPARSNRPAAQRAARTP